MGFLHLPVQNNIPAYEFETDLDGASYRFGFRYNARVDGWHMDILTVDEIPIRTGIRLVGGVSLLAVFQDPLLPPGVLFCFDTAGNNSTPTIETFGTTVLLVYQEVGGG